MVKKTEHWSSAVARQCGRILSRDTVWDDRGVLVSTGVEVTLVIAFLKADSAVHLISVHFILWKLYFNQKKRKNRGKREGWRKGGRERKGKEKWEREKVVVPGAGRVWADGLGSHCQQLRKEDRRAPKGQGLSQNFVIFQEAKLNLDIKGRHILEMQNGKDELWTVISAPLV